MVSRFNNKNFFAAHYDWIALGVGVLALLAGAAMYVISMGGDPDEATDEATASVRRLKPSQTGVKEYSMEVLQNTLRQTRSPALIADLAVKQESFLASERRIFCKCKKAIPGDIKAFPTCPFCGAKQEEEVKVVVDQDGDGLPDEWERKYGLNPNSAADAGEDADKDGFTNLEEFTAKTDPTDRRDHPDYLDSLKIVLPLNETKLPFAFTKATPIRDGWRCEFVDPQRKNDLNQFGRKFSVKVGEAVVDAKDAKNKVDYGFVLKKFERKSVRTEKKGMKGMFVDIDISEALLERKRDGKSIKLVIQPGRSVKSLKLAPMDIEAKLTYERGTVQTFTAVPGAELDLNGTKYRVTDIKQVAKGAKIVIEEVNSGKKRTLEALEH